MRNKKTILLGVLALVMAYTACAQKYDNESDFRVRSLDGGKSVEITAYVGKKQIVNIPPRIEGMTVTRIGDNAFEYDEAWGYSDIIKVTIPNTVTSIGSTAFSMCTSLASITIPASITSIDFGAFNFCQSLTSITIPASVTSVDTGAFGNWTASQTIYIAGHTSQAEADKAWNKGSYGWRYACNANIVYQGRN